MVVSEEDAQWKKIQELGMKVNEVEKAPFVEATKSVIEKYRGVFGPELIDQIISAK